MEGSDEEDDITPEIGKKFLKALGETPLLPVMHKLDTDRTGFKEMLRLIGGVLPQLLMFIKGNHFPLVKFFMEEMVDVGQIGPYLSGKE